MQFTPSEHTHGFAVEKAEALDEIDGFAYVMRHEASGARLLLLANDDANKAFSISFKTPPKDDTGVFHILEHSVLCGSRKFPVKEPFVNLLKNSMQTFLNAMTFGDKTMYPVASTNEQDLLNLMDVYLDAVLHPAIYERETIFEQEGWHLELDEGKTEPSFNGVVFNEMKGALSSPDAVVYDEMQAALFPDTAYKFESGGKPAAIPSLSYKGFLDHHSRHYRLDNSYIVLYGDLDADKFLAFLDEEYLTPDALLHRDAGAPNELGFQQPVKSLGNRVSLVTAPSNSYYAFGYVLGDVHDHVRLMAANILLDVLAGSNEAPLKRAVLKAGIAVDFETYVADALQQPFVILQIKGLRNGAQERFGQLVRETLSSLVEKGLDHERIAASLSHAEFVSREANYGMSDGVALSMASLAGWLYDDDLAIDYLRFEDEFAQLRALLEEGYFERLVSELFLDNAHIASVELVPVEKLDHDPLAQRRAAVKESLDDQLAASIEAKVEALRLAQESPDSPADLEKLPHLGVKDIDPAPKEPEYRLQADTPLPCLRHEVHTRGIAYAFRYFDLDRFSFDEIQYVSVVALLLGKLDTAKHSVEELDTLLRANLGELNFVAEVHEDIADASKCMPRLCVGASALVGKAAKLASIPDEIMRSTRFDDLARIREILDQRRSRMEEAFAEAGHSAAMNRVATNYLPAAILRDQMGGVSFYRFLCKLLDEFDARAAELPGLLSGLAMRMFDDSRCLLSFAGTDEALAEFWTAHALNAQAKAASKSDGEASIAAVCSEAQLVIPAPAPKNEAFIVPSDVTYTATGFDRRALGVEHSGLWSLAVRALSYDYLWNEVRVKGGAYGCGFQATRSGNLRFYSFRDPRIDETVERFSLAGAWLKAFDPSDEEFEGYIVSTVAGVDNPVKARDLVRRQDGWFFAGLTPDERLKTRDELVSATVEGLRSLADCITALCEEGYVCTFGNKDIIEASDIDFEVCELMAQSAGEC